MLFLSMAVCVLIGQFQELSGVAAYQHRTATPGIRYSHSIPYYKCVLIESTVTIPIHYTTSWHRVQSQCTELHHTSPPGGECSIHFLVVWTVAIHHTTYIYMYIYLLVESTVTGHYTMYTYMYLLVESTVTGHYTTCR